MRYAAIILAILIPGAAFGQHAHEARERSAVIMPGLGKHHHPVSTSNREAQRFFDQGLSLVYAFNHDEATLSFRRAAELDPALAIAHWGVALSVGPNYNLEIDPDRAKTAYEAIQKALALSSQAPANERAYIEALARRYSADPKADLKQLALDYKNAMGEVVKRYPDDLDAATLYAESMMNLRPWKLWSKEGKPEEGTEEIVSVLESVLKRDPKHIGANHLYIHAVEASPNPERGLASAEALKTLAPSAGHLVHMPAHIQMRVGDYNSAALSNEAGAEADRLYIRSRGGQGVYPMMYYNHNVHFLTAAYGMAGRFEDAKRAAAELHANLAPQVKQMPMVDAMLPASSLVLVRFRRWNDILNSPEPSEDMPATRAMWLYSRATAYVGTGQTSKAEAERKAFLAAVKALPPERLWGFTTVSNIMKIADNVLGARISLAKGDTRSAIDLFKQAIALEDQLPYTEPPDWDAPTRESLGGALLRARRYREAEEVFREDLKRNARSGRSLFGLFHSLRAQGKRSEAEKVEKEFKDAWRYADTPLRIADL
jgi:tetratricopeptide (TPR) repeat protein